MEWVKLGDVVDIKTGKLNANAAVENGKYPFFTTAEEISRIDTYSYDDEVILVAGNGELNVKYYKGKFDAYQRTYILTLKENQNYILKFIYYFLSSYIKILRYQAIGGVIKYIKLENLTEAKLPVLTIKEQEKLIDIFENLETLIQTRQDQIQALDDLLESVFNESLNESYDIVKIKDYVKVNPAKSEVKKLDPDTIISFVPMEDVSENGELNLSKTKTIEEAYKGFTYFKNDDVVVAKITPCFENGKGTLMKNLVNGIGFGTTEFHVLRCKNRNVLNPVWLNHLTRTRYFRELGEIRMSGSAGQKRVGKNFVENFEFNLPPIEKQNQFAAFVEKNEKQKQILNDSLGDLTNLFDSLMQDAFDGSMTM